MRRGVAPGMGDCVSILQDSPEIGPAGLTQSMS
jgi:hypothetical protein